MKLILTSTGLKGQLFQDLFTKNLKHSVYDAKVIFVPTAAIDDEAKSKLPSCRADIANAGIMPDNVLNYDLDYLLPYEDAIQYDAIYFCGGSTKHLLNRINTIGFAPILNKLVANGQLFIGVSAGSKICGDNYPGNLGILHRNIELHCETGSPSGKVDWQGTINLTDTQALFISDDEWEIFD
jgi:peptidase E